MRPSLLLHGGLLDHAHDGLLRAGIRHGIGPPVADNQQRRSAPVLGVPAAGQIYLCHQFDAPGRAHGGPADGDAQLEGPATLQRQEEPEQQPGAQVEQRAADTAEHDAVEAAPVDDRVVVEQGGAAGGRGQEDAEGRRVRHVGPAGVAAAAADFRQDHAALALVVNEGHESAGREGSRGVRFLVGGFGSTRAMLVEASSGFFVTLLRRAVCKPIFSGFFE